MSRALRFLFVSLLVGALSLGSAWAGVVLSPAPDLGADLGADLTSRDSALPSREARGDGDQASTAQRSPAGVTLPEHAADGARRALAALGEGQVYAGAAKVSITPQPGEGQEWKKEGCKIVGSDADKALTHVGDLRNRWPEDPNCIYMGGYGVGPSYPIKTVDPEYGLWVRSVALGDGTDTVVLTMIDATSFFGRYNNMCEDCGAFDIAEQMSKDATLAGLGLAPSSFFIASTHSHTAPDLIGGWGGVPQWYMDQITAAIRTSITEAVTGMQPAVLENGEAIARQFNGERRDFYRSAEDPTLTWFRALAVDEDGEVGRAIATVGAYAAHPVTVSAGPGVGDADFPGVFAKRVEERFGGVGAYFMTGLGNVSPRGNKLEMGNGLANLIPQNGQGVRVSGTDVRAAQDFWDQPITNSGLTALGTPGFFDRPFTPAPATIAPAKDPSRPCRSAAGVSVRTAVSVAKVGNMTIAGAPGETFSNLSATIKERTPGAVSFPLGQVNDGLGYIIQSFETDHAGRQAVGFVGSAGTPKESPVQHKQGLAEYEDAYSLDACFGDQVLETTIRLIGTLK